MLHTKQNLIALAFGLLLGPVSSTPESLQSHNQHLAQNLNVSSNLTPEALHLKPREDSNGGHYLCRVIDRADDFKHNPRNDKRALDRIPAVKHNRTSHAIQPRLLDLITAQVNMNTFMVARTGEDADPNIFTEVYDGDQDPEGRDVNTAVFSLLNRRLDLGLHHLHGCTALVVVSREAVYFAHYFENPSFTGEENPVTQWENFQIQVIDFLESGIPRHDGQGDRYLGLTEVADYFQTGVEIHIMTPQFEIINTPIGVVEYKRPAELQYNDMIMLLLAKTRLILDGRARTTPVSPFIWAYQPEDDREGSVGSMRLDTTRRGRALYQFDPLGRVRNRGNAIYRRARLIMEGDDLFNRHRQVEFGQVYFDEWQDEDAELRILTTPDDLSCGGQIYSEDEYTCYGERLCPVLSGVSTLLCGLECYLTSQYTCYGTLLCPVLDGVRTLQCGSACYLSSQYSCANSQLIQITPDIPPPYTQSGIITSSQIKDQGSEMVINGTTYFIGSQTSTLIIDGETIVIGPGTIVVGSETVAIPASPTGPVVVTADGLAITFKPSRPQSTSASPSNSNLIPTLPITEVIIDESTFTLGPTSSTITVNGTAIIIGPSGVVIGTKTVNLPATQTAPSAVTTHGITFTVHPGTASLTSTAVPGGTPTRSLPTPTPTPFEPITRTVRTLTASDGSRTQHITFAPTTLSQYTTVTAVTSVTTVTNGHNTTMVVGSGGVVWEPVDSTSLSGFPPIEYPSLPPYPQSSNTFVPPITSPSSSNFFPSSQFPLPPIVTSEITTTGPDGPIVTRVTGTTNSGGSVVPVVTLSTKAAISTASSLVAEYSSLSNAINAFSSSTADSAKASAAASAVDKSESDTNGFGLGLGISLPGLCFLFCGSVSSAANLLAGFEKVIESIIAGTTGSGALTPLLDSLSEITDELEGKIEQAKGSTSIDSSPCSLTTVPHCEVVCATGFIEGTVMTSGCMLNTCSAVSSCGATAATSTITQSSFCPESREPAGPMTLFSFPGFVGSPIGTWGPDEPDEPETSTSITSTFPSSSFLPDTTFSTSTLPATPTPPPPAPIVCGAPQPCDASGCDGTLVDNKATCKGNFATCTCIPNANTPGFSCGNPQSCESNTCGGRFANGKATCTNASAGCRCFPSTNTPGFSCGNPQPCEANECSGSTSNGVSTCKKNLAGCACIRSWNTPGLNSGENLILSDCGIGLGANGGSTSREMMYYAGDVWRSDGTVISKPNMMVNVPWDGSYPWRSSSVSAKFPNGDTFKVTINPGFKDPAWAGWAFHTYNEAALLCYSFHKERLYKLDDGKWCSSAYVCNHGDAPVFDKPNPPPQPAPAPQPQPEPVPQDRMETYISASKNFVGIYAQFAQTVFGHVKERIGSGNECRETAVKLNSRCDISFKCQSAGEKVSLNDVTSFLINDMPKVPGFASSEEVTYDGICKKFDTRPGREGQCLQYTQKVDKYLVIPKSLDIQVRTIPPSGSGRQPKAQARLRYDITCSKSLTCELCSFFHADTPSLGGWGGPVVALDCDAICSSSSPNCELCSLIEKATPRTVPWGGAVSVNCDKAC